MLPDQDSIAPLYHSVDHLSLDSVDQSEFLDVAIKLKSQQILEEIETQGQTSQLERVEDHQQSSVPLKEALKLEVSQFNKFLFAPYLLL